MDHVEFFFNFFLGKEVAISGDLLYLGFKNMKNKVLEKPEHNKEFQYYNSTDSFNFLLSYSIAFERLGKVIILFLINDNDPDKIKKLLKDFYDFIEKKHKKELSDKCNSFIENYIEPAEREKFFKLLKKI